MASLLVIVMVPVPRLGVAKYEPLLFFRKLYNSCMSARALSSLRSLLYPKSIPNPYECMHEKRDSVHAHTQVVKDFQKSRTAHILNDVHLGSNCNRL